MHSQHPLAEARGLAGMPQLYRLYLDHSRAGLSLRALARREGLHPSTVMRQIRRAEAARDDPLVNAALHRLETSLPPEPPWHKEVSAMTAPLRPETLLRDPDALAREGRRVLRRLAEPGARLLVSPEMEKAVVIRREADGRELRTAVLDSGVAQAFVLKDWISCRTTGERMALYELTIAGRAALRRLMAAEDTGETEEAQPFADQHRAWGQREIAADAPATAPRRLRVNLAESPVTLLGRRRDKDGQPFLTPEQVTAAERLREDFELAQLGPRVAQNWDRFLTGGGRGDFAAAEPGGGGSAQSARDRVGRALRELGPGLGDMVLRCCCYLEGLEAAEKRLGWSARSGKVVLRIALDRLRRHYEDTYGGSSRMIG